MTVFFGVVFGLLILVGGCALIGILVFKYLQRYDAKGQQIYHLANEIFDAASVVMAQHNSAEIRQIQSAARRIRHLL